MLDRSLRAACALDDLVARHRLDAGAINCHVPEIRFGDDIGIAPCFALGRQTSRGIPWACAGDVVTAVAMMTLKGLGAAAQYHELESLDYETGELVVASSGEHDLAFAGEQPRLVRNHWFDRDARCGACACFGAPPGPATLVGFTEIDAPAPATASSSLRGVHRDALAGRRDALRGLSLREWPAPSRPGRAGAARAPTITRQRRPETSANPSRASRASSGWTLSGPSVGQQVGRRRTWILEYREG